MKDYEILLTQFINAKKTRKFAIVFVLAGIIICLMPLFSPLQNVFLFLSWFIVLGREEAGDKILALFFIGLVVFIFVFCCLFSKHITSFIKNSKNTKLIFGITAGLCVLFLCFISVFSYRYGWQWLDSDNSSEMVLGKLLAQENSLVSRNWYYSTEIRLIYQTIFTMPLFKLFGSFENWALIRALNILLNNVFLILSYLFMMKQMKIQTKYVMITSLFLIAPISFEYWDIVIFGGYYIFFIVQLFFIIGLFLRLSGYTGFIKTSLIDFILFTFLSFALGVQGIRALYSIHIPLLITSVYIWYKMREKKNLILFFGCYSFIVCSIGYTVNNLLSTLYNFHSFNGKSLTNLFDNFFPKLGQSIVSLPKFFGLEFGRLFLSPQGVLGVITIIGTIIFFAVVFKMIKSSSDTQAKTPECQFFLIFFVVSVIFNIFIFIIFDAQITSRYFITFMVLYIPTLAFLFEYIEKVYGHFKYTAIVFGIILFISGKSYINIQELKINKWNTRRMDYIQYLLDNQLNYGFATFWNANVTTELSNGKIEMVGMTDDYNIYLWLSETRHSDPFNHQGEVFLLLTSAEWRRSERARTSPLFVQHKPDYEDEEFIIIRYPSCEQIHLEVLSN